MKRLLILFITACAIASCNDDCDHGFDKDRPIADILVGSWYEETQNEEDTYSASGTFYGKFCNTLVQGDGRGTYFIDSERNRLTQSYNVNGSPQMSDWKLTNVTNLGFTMSSDVATLSYGKIVETYNMEGGDTKQIVFNQGTINGYESKNSNIATVTSEGLITATGEKGTTYIKIKSTVGDVWAKVVIGDDTPDLWIDYSFLLGRDFAAMKDTLGTYNQSQDYGDYTSYSYITSIHNILDYINVYVDNGSHSIEQIDMHIKEGVTQEEILAYMNSHYYRIAGNYVNQYHYSTASALEESRAAYAYNTTNKTVIVMSTEDYMIQMGLMILPNFSSVFGLGKEELKENMQSKGYSFYQSFDAYSQNGSDAYFINGYDKVYAAEFIFNPDNVVSEYWLYLSVTEQDREALSEILKYLRDHYTEAADEYVEGYGMIFYNKDKTVKVRYDLSSFAVVFTDLTKKAVSRIILGNYWKGLGMAKSELITTFGEPYLERNNDKGNLQCFYAVVNDFIASVTFNFNKNEVVNLINIFLRDEVNAEVVKNYLNKLYTFQEEEASDNGPKLKWLNAATEEEADMRISFYPDYGVVAYAPVKEEAEPETSRFSLPDYTDMFGKTKTQVQEMIQSKGGALGLIGSQVWYRNPTEDGIDQIWFDFDTTGDWKCNQIIFWLDMTDLTEDIVADYLKSQYSLKSEWKGIRYVFDDAANAVNITYEPSLKKITF